MALTTRCPNCRTAFKVVADQLRVRNGLVRCGSCSTVFDGRARLEGDDIAEAAKLLKPDPSEFRRPSPAQPPKPEPKPEPDPQHIPSFLADPPAAPVHSTPKPPAAKPVAHLNPPPMVVIPPPAVLRGRDRLMHEPTLEQAPEPAPMPLLEPEPDEAPEDDAFKPDDVYAAGEHTLPVIRAVEPEAQADHGMHGIHAPIRAYDPEDDPPEQDEPEFTVGGVQRAADEPAAGNPVYGDVRTRYSSATDVGRAPPEFLDQDRIKSHDAMRRVWNWLCMLGLLALAGQLLYVYRTPIAISVPTLRPALAGACRLMGCQVSYARRIERIFIESSSLRPPQQADLQHGTPAAADGASRLILAAVLRNRYDKPQEWPALVLSLTDMSDTVIARKIIRPQDYLPPGTSGPMAAGAEVTISVPIAVTGLKVNGYQIDKFFP